jgi:Mak10 subunit, NatC N(alpha)-terminal acetyltransferase
MMDPKMDAGMITPSPESRGKMDIKSIPLPISPSRFIGLADSLLGAHHEWHSGRMLATTVMSCVYMHSPAEITCRPFRMLVEITMGCLHLGYEQILDAQIFYEEDFLPDLAEFELNVHGEEYTEIMIAKSDESNAVAEAIEKAANSKDDKRLRDIFGTGELDLSGLSLESSATDKNEEDYAAYIAVAARMKFISSLWHVMYMMYKEDHGQAAFLADETIPFLDKIIETSNLARDVDDAFDPVRNYHLFVQVPSKPNTKLDTLAGLKKWRDTLGHIKWVSEFTTVWHPNLISDLEAMSRKMGDPTILVRSFMFKCIIAARTIMEVPIHLVISTHIYSFSAAPYFKSEDAMTEQICNKILGTCVEPFLSLARIFTFNRPRQRRRLFHVLVQWEALQQKIEPVESMLFEHSGGTNKVRTSH